MDHHRESQMKTKILAIAFASLLPFAAFADISYSNVDINYQFSGGAEDNFGASADTDGYGLRGQFSVNDSWYVQFDYLTLGTDPNAGDVDTYALSAGWHNEMFFARLGFESADALGVDGSGYIFDVGLRSEVGEGFELNAHLGMSDNGDVGSSVNYGVGAVYMFNDNMGVSFNYDLRTISDFGNAAGYDVDFDTMGLGFRYNF